MEINVTSKYNYGDTIYFMSDNKVCKGTIELVLVYIRQDRNPDIRYSVGTKYLYVDESNAYTTQEELFQSIQYNED